MKSSPSTSDAFRTLGKFFKRFQTLVFLIIVFGGLSIAALSVGNLLLDTSGTPAAPSGTTAPTADQTTIDELNALYTSADSPAHYQLPPGRTNPFAE